MERISEKPFVFLFWYLFFQHQAVWGTEENWGAPHTTEGKRKSSGRVNKGETGEYAPISEYIVFPTPRRHSPAGSTHRLRYDQDSGWTAGKKGFSSFMGKQETTGISLSGQQGRDGKDWAIGAFNWDFFFSCFFFFGWMDGYDRSHGPFPLSLFLVYRVRIF